MLRWQACNLVCRTQGVTSNAVVSGKNPCETHERHAYLCSSGMRQDPAVLEDEQRLDNARGLLAALLPRRPAQRFQLHLPVDAGKLTALLQHRLAGKKNLLSGKS